MKERRSKEELKRLALEAIDKRREDILALGDDIYSEPELGYKEFKTAKKLTRVFSELGIPFDEGIAITGVKGKLKGRSDAATVGVMAELDSVVSPQHPNADPQTGAAHCCGHNAMMAALAGVAYALTDTDILEDLDGDVALIAVPAEEFVELGYRKTLIEEGKIHFMSGKQEFIRLGVFDDIDVIVMQHTFGGGNEENPLKAMAGESWNGFLGQEVTYIGKEAHAGMAPHSGINALAAAQVGLFAINLQRETFQEKDFVRVHPIITKGGDLVNVIPGEVKIETQIRASTLPAILETAEKVSRSWKAGADALGAKVIIDTLPGYLPVRSNELLVDLTYKNMVELFGEEYVLKDSGHETGSSDIGDVGAILPAIQFRVGGSNNKFHASDFRLLDRDLAYLGAAKLLVMDVIDLLYEGAEAAKKVVEEFEPLYTKEEYLSEWGGIGERFK